jgi:hypothetical protein
MARCGRPVSATLPKNKCETPVRPCVPIKEIDVLQSGTADDFQQRVTSLDEAPRAQGRTFVGGQDLVQACACFLFQVVEKVLGQRRVEPARIGDVGIRHDVQEVADAANGFAIVFAYANARRDCSVTSSGTRTRFGSVIPVPCDREWGRQRWR